MRPWCSKYRTQSDLAFRFYVSGLYELGKKPAKRLTIDLEKLFIRLCQFTTNVPKKLYFLQGQVPRFFQKIYQNGFNTICPFEIARTESLIC